MAASDAKLALFYDWLVFEPERDSIMNIGKTLGFSFIFAYIRFIVAVKWFFYTQHKKCEGVEYASVCTVYMCEDCK